MGYSPAFQFYPKDYLGDKNTIPMSTLETGAYLLLIMHCWEEDGLPPDLGDLADMCRLSVEEFTALWDRRLRKCFDWNEKKNVFEHPRLLKEIKKQKSWKKQKSEAGKAGMRNRWKQTTSSDNTVITPLSSVITEHNSSSSFSSSSSSEKNKEAAIAAPTPEATFEPDRFNHPAVVEFEAAFGFTPGSGFATSVARKVTRLDIWKQLLENKRAFADKPLIERRKVCNWILDEYDNRTKDIPKKLPTVDEVLRDRAEGLRPENRIPPPPVPIRPVIQPNYNKS